jgi:murein DD-endopeptidase MepM/ murein hydrolase activator NlpD
MQALSAARAPAWLLGCVATAVLALAAARTPWTWAGAPGPSPVAPWRLRLEPTEPTPWRELLSRAGMRAADAAAAAQLLGQAVGSDSARGQRIDAEVERPRDGDGLRLIELSLADGGASLTRAADGSLRLNETAASPPADGAGGLKVVQGPVEDVLYGGGAGERPITASAARLFAERLDLTRDIELGDEVRLVYAPGGGAGALRYAEIDTRKGPLRFYWHQGPGGGQYVDEAGEELGRTLLRTPVSDARITSRFGMRLHPLLGYTREHQGVDFGAPAGAEVLAAADGVIEQARWAGGYGRWIEVRHTGGLETGYAHLSAWAPGLHVGEAIRRGQVIGYVGSSGLATGPHLHFEVRRDGRPVDPARMHGDEQRLAEADLAALALERQRIADLLGASRTPG